MRLICLVCLLGLVPAVYAQPTADSSAKETVRFLRQSWAIVRTQGPKAIDEARLKWPSEIRQIGSRTTEFADTWLKKTDPVTLQERARLLAELWRIRGSLNLLGLLSPANLKAVTGLDLSQFQELSKQVNRWKLP